MTQPFDRYQVIVIGGGLGAEMVAALARLPAVDRWFGLPVAAARLGDDAGVIGAGLAAAEAIMGDGSRLAHFEHLHHRNIIGGRYLRIPASMIGSTYYRFKDAR